jgi:hypothetical protein
MKKFFAVLIVCTLAFAACDNGNTGHTHEWGEWETLTTADCTTAGVEEKVCLLNSSHKETRTVAEPLGHDWGGYSEPTDPTETEDGVKTRVCGRDPSHIDISVYATAGLAYELINGNTAYSVRKGTVTSGVVHIPPQYRPDTLSSYLPVTEIGKPSDGEIRTGINGPYTNIRDGAFWKTDITAVYLPNTITAINNGAFYECRNLASITIPEGTVFGYFVFYDCRSLTGSITIPDGETTIGDHAFNTTKLTSITIPDSVTTIGINAFTRCTSIASITIPAGVTSVGIFTFVGWTPSQTINIMGHASEASADTAWPDAYPGGSWRASCNATINYLGH